MEEVYLLHIASIALFLAHLLQWNLTCLYSYFLKLTFKMNHPDAVPTGPSELVLFVASGKRVRGESRFQKLKLDNFNFKMDTKEPLLGPCHSISLNLSCSGVVHAESNPKLSSLRYRLHT